MSVDGVEVRVSGGARPHPVVEAVDGEENRWTFCFRICKLAPEGTPDVKGERGVVGAEEAELLE